MAKPQVYGNLVCVGDENDINTRISFYSSMLGIKHNNIDAKSSLSG